MLFNLRFTNRDNEVVKDIITTSYSIIQSEMKLYYFNNDTSQIESEKLYLYDEITVYEATTGRRIENSKRGEFYV